MSVQELLHDAAAPVAPLHRRVSARQGFAALCVALILVGAMLLLLRPGSVPLPDRLGATKEDLLTALREVRSSHRVTSQNPEEQYQALER